MCPSVGGSSQKSQRHPSSQMRVGDAEVSREPSHIRYQGCAPLPKGDLSRSSHAESPLPVVVARAAEVGNRFSSSPCWIPSYLAPDCQFARRALAAVASAFLWRLGGLMRDLFAVA